MRLTILTAAAALAVLVAFGRGPGGQGRRGGPDGPGGIMRMLPIMTALDADEDGETSGKEIENAAALEKLDKHENGKLTADERHPTRSEPGGDGRVRRETRSGGEHERCSHRPDAHARETVRKGHRT